VFRSTAARRITTIDQAIDGFQLSCKVEGKSYGTEEEDWHPLSCHTVASLPQAGGSPTIIPRSAGFKHSRV
jgi:hypothetical protein